MKKVKITKPIKKKDIELWSSVSEAILNKDYIFMKHAIKRQDERDILDIDVLDILEDKEKRKRKRNKSKDVYIPEYKDWNYCVEGSGLDGDKIRVIISFDEKSMLVITVIRPEAE